MATADQENNPQVWATSPDKRQAEGLGGKTDGKHTEYGQPLSELLSEEVSRLQTRLEAAYEYDLESQDKALRDMNKRPVRTEASDRTAAARRSADVSLAADSAARLLDLPELPSDWKVPGRAAAAARPVRRSASTSTSTSTGTSTDDADAALPPPVERRAELEMSSPGAHEQRGGVVAPPLPPMNDDLGRGLRNLITTELESLHQAMGASISYDLDAADRELRALNDHSPKRPPRRRGREFDDEQRLVPAAAPPVPAATAAPSADPRTGHYDFRGVLASMPPPAPPPPRDSAALDAEFEACISGGLMVDRLLGGLDGFSSGQQLFRKPPMPPSASGKPYEPSIL